MTPELLRAPYLAVERGLPDVVLNTLGADTTRHVRDADGQVLATVRRLRRRGPLHAAHRVAGFLQPMFEPSRDLAVADAGGVPVLRLRAAGRDLLVDGPSGERLGVANNASRLSGAYDLAVNVYAGDVRPGRGTPVASFSGPGNQESFDYEVRSPAGPLGRLRTEDSYHLVLEAPPGADEAVRTLLVGVLCGLVDRRWWRLPRRPLP